MILAPLSTLAHHVNNRPACASWLAFSDGHNVRLYGSSPHWQFVAIEALQQLAEAVAITVDGITREAIDAFDCANLDSEQVSPLAPYYPAYVFGAVTALTVTNRLRIPHEALAMATSGIRQRRSIPTTIRPTPETERILSAVARMR